MDLDAKERAFIDQNFQRFGTGWGSLAKLEKSFVIENGAVTSARWIELPANESGLLPIETIDFLDQAFKKHGDFGVYGSVSEGLRALARIENFRLQIHRNEDNFGIALTPKDGHGHFLHFPVDRKTGEIGPCAAGHLVPQPPPD